MKLLFCVVGMALLTMIACHSCVIKLRSQDMAYSSIQMVDGVHGNSIKDWRYGVDSGDLRLDRNMNLVVDTDAVDGEAASLYNMGDAISLRQAYAADVNYVDGWFFYGIRSEPALCSSTTTNVFADPACTLNLQTSSAANAGFVPFNATAIAALGSLVQDPVLSNYYPGQMIIIRKGITPVGGTYRDIVISKIIILEKSDTSVTLRWSNLFDYGYYHGGRARSLCTIHSSGVLPQFNIVSYWSFLQLNDTSWIVEINIIFLIAFIVIYSMVVGLFFWSCRAAQWAPPANQAQRPPPPQQNDNADKNVNEIDLIEETEMVDFS